LLGIVLLAAGPSGYLTTHFSGWSNVARAADTGSAQPVEGNFPHPASFADLVAKEKPAVISVRVKIQESADTLGDENDVVPFAPNSPMEKFFQRFGFPPNGMPHRREIITGEGSGFFISPDGYAVTNDHVVDNAKSVQVTADDGSIYTAKVIGTDRKTDLALIKVASKTTFLM
jgi:serine protease Do